MLGDGGRVASTAQPQKQPLEEGHLPGTPPDKSRTETKMKTESERGRWVLPHRATG